MLPNNHPVAANPILPRFSIRKFLWVTALLGGVSLVIARAVRGEIWAMAFSLSLLFVGLAFVLFTLVYAMAFVINVRSPRVIPPTSPFAGENPPEQIMVPVEQFPKT